MNPRHFMLLTILALLLAGLWVLAMKPEEPLDLSKDEEPFRSMVLPPKSVWPAIVFDGGSILMFVKDQRDVIHVVTFPFDREGIFTSYKEAYNGDFDGYAYGAKLPLKNPARAKAIMLRLYRDYGDKNDEFYELTLRSFSERPSVLARKFSKRFFD